MLCISCKTQMDKKQQLEDIEKREKKSLRENIEKEVLPFSNDCAVFMIFFFFFSHSGCAKSSRVLSIYPLALPGKVNIPLPNPNAHTHSAHTTTLLDVMIYIAPFSFFVAPPVLIHLICLCSTVFLPWILEIKFPPHASVCLSAFLLAVGTGANTLEVLQCLAQLQWAVVLNRIWLYWVDTVC